MQRTPFRFRHKASKKRIKFYEDKQVVKEVFQKFQETGWTLQEIFLTRVFKNGILIIKKTSHIDQERN